MAIIMLITVLPGQGQPQAKIDSLLKVIDDARADTSMVNNLNDLSQLFRQAYEFETALQYADSARVMALRLKYLKGEADALNNLGIVYREMGSYEESLDHHHASLQIYEKTGDRKGKANAINNLGIIYSSQGNHPEGLRHYLASLKIKEEIGDKPGVANSYNNIGTIYESQGDYEEALKYHKMSLKIKEEIGDKKGMAGSYNNIGMIYDNLGMYEEALENYYIAIEINEETGNRFRLAGNYINIGVAHMYREKYREALESFTHALSIAYEIGAEEMFASIHTNLGRINMQLGRFDQARSQLETALDHAQGIGNKYDILAIYETLFTLDSTQGRWKQAFDHLLLYKSYNDSVFNEDSEFQIARMKMEYETEKKDQEIELLNKDNEIKSLQLSRQKAIRHGLSAGIVMLFVTGFLLFRSFRLRKKLEQQQAIISERKRISADLHDDVGSGLSRIMLLTELVKREARTPEMKQEAEKIAKISSELSSNISEIIWALNANNDTLESLVAYIRRHAAEFFEDSELQFRINTPVGIADIPLSGEKRRDIFYTVKEALHNIHKHAQATEAELSFSVNGGELTVMVRDNGRGIPEEAKNDLGNGLRNMRQRMESVGGSFDMENHQGTKITLKVPVP